MFKIIRPILRIATALEQIAEAMTYFAVADARENGRIFMIRKPGWRFSKDESELMHTDSAEIDRLRTEEQDLISNRGFAILDNMESRDE